MTRRFPIVPAPPRPPSQFTYEWANQLTRWLESQLRLNQFPYLRGSGLYLLDLPEIGYGLTPGEVFSNSGVLTIVREGDMWVGSQQISTAVGTLSVTIT